MELDEEKRVENLGNKAVNASVMREWLKHPGYRLFKAEMERTSKRDHSLWLAAENDEEANKIREKSKWVFQFEAIVKKLILAGDVARHSLNTILKEQNNEQNLGEQNAAKQ